MLADLIAGRSGRPGARAATLLQARELDGSAYRLTHEQASGVLAWPAPFPLTLDLDDLPR